MRLLVSNITLLILTRDKQCCAGSRSLYFLNIFFYYTKIVFLKKVSVCIRYICAKCYEILSYYLLTYALSFFRKIMLCTLNANFLTETHNKLTNMFKKCIPHVFSCKNHVECNLKHKSSWSSLNIISYCLNLIKKP